MGNWFETTPPGLGQLQLPGAFPPQPACELEIFLSWERSWFIPSPELSSKPCPSSRRLPNSFCHFPLAVLVLELLQVKGMQKPGGPKHQHSFGPKHHHGFGPHLVQLGTWEGALCLAVCPHGMCSWLSPSLEMTGPGLTCTPQTHPVCDWFRLLAHLSFFCTFLQMLRAI